MESPRVYKILVKEYFKKLRRKHNLMCEDFCRELVWVFYKEKLEDPEIKSKLDELKKDCKFEEKMFGENKCTVMTEATPEYRIFYNDQVVNAALKLALDVGIYKLKRKGKVMQVWCDRPGLLIGCKGKTIDALLEGLKTKSLNTAVTKLNKIEKIQLKGDTNPFIDGCYSIQYHYIQSRNQDEW